MSDPTLLLCIGATKAGTTWLYDYLSAHPQCHMHDVKELHYFDTRSGSDRAHYLAHASKRIREAKQAAPRRGVWAKLTSDPVVQDLKHWRDALAQDDPAHQVYWHYLCRGAKDARLVADITPCYATLGREDFAQMAAVARDVRFVFLMRDPVDRAWSHARMIGKRRAAKTGAERETIIDRVFKRFVSGEEMQMFTRSDYARTLTELFAAVPRERVHVEFYEDLFTQGAVDRLCAFLGIDPFPAPVEEVVFAGKPRHLPQPLAKRAVARLAEQYAFVETLFDGYLPARWRTRMMEA